MGAEDLLGYVRGHWQVENKLHWCLDVSFREDHSRVRKGHGAQNLSRMRRWAINLLLPMPARNQPPNKTARKVSLKVKRLMCSWDRDYLLKALTGKK